MTTTFLIIGGLTLIFGGYIFYNYQKVKNISVGPENPKIKNLDDKSFQHLIKSGISLVDFWAAWCMPCKLMVPVLNELAEEIGDDVNICKLNIEQYQSIASKHSVRSIPTMILFKNGREVDRIVGVKTKDFLVKKIEMLKFK